MDHRHFEEKLLNDEQFSPEEDALLQEHLRVCDSCAALADASLALGNVVMATPAPGFTSRFQSRLAAQRKMQRRRYFFGGIILFLGGMGFILWQVSPILPAALHAPWQLLLSWADALVIFISSAKMIGELGQVLLRVIANFIPAYAWVLGMTLFAALSLMWVSSVQKFARLSYAR